MNNSNTVMIVAQHLLSHHGGALFLRELCRVLEDKGVEITVITEDKHSSGIPSSWDKIILNNFWKRNNLIGRMSDSAQMIRVVRNMKPVFVIVFGDLPRFTYILLQLHAPIIFNRHDGLLCCPAGTRYLPSSRNVCKIRFGLCCLGVNRREGCLKDLRFLLKIGRILNRKRDAFLLKFLRHKLFNSNYCRTIHGYPNAPVLFPVTFTREREKKGCSSSTRNLCKLLFVGRLIKTKGIEDALKVLSFLPEKYSLTIIGDGEGRQKMKDLSSSLNLDNRIKILGWVNSLAVYEELCSAGALILPSICDETFGRVGPEAFSAGTPVVAYDVGGVSEWCKEPYGVLVKCGDIQGMADAVSSMTVDEENWEKRSRKAKEWVLKSFSEEVFQESFKMALDNFNVNEVSAVK